MAVKKHVVAAPGPLAWSFCDASPRWRHLATALVQLMRRAGWRVMGGDLPLWVLAPHIASRRVGLRQGTQYNKRHGEGCPALSQLCLVREVALLTYSSWRLG
ncbi:hypothetical protein IF1G_10790 [Cordyceps javanica]|uniref:Uncharacterized protein n=1 Tax=Cordyceps javanica TaxID=43265 RepID=A0A545UME2_9HYPO|nr:hypothetical protein IF1G_10790 [Cordyceps javanica]